MSVPTLVQLRDQLGRALVQNPNAPVLHTANSVLNATFAARERLKPAVRLGAARAVAIALDFARAGTLTSGETMPLLADALDPAKQTELGWWARAIVAGAVDTRTGRPVQSDTLLELANALDRAQDSVRNGLEQAPLDVANALDRAKQAVLDSARDVGQGALDAAAAASRAAILPVALGVTVLLAWGWSRRRG